MRLFGTSGIRRKETELTESFVSRFAEAFSLATGRREVVIGRDTRRSSPRLERSLIAHLQGEVKLCGLVTTPTLAFASRGRCGVMITASHNPPDWNGFKLFWDGMPTPPELERRVEELFATSKPRPARRRVSGSEDNWPRLHAEAILKSVKSCEGLRVLVDCAGGSGSTITPWLLDQMGCEVEAINTRTDGTFPHDLEPTSRSSISARRIVANRGFDLGIVHDGDADRAALILGDGEFIPWDDFLAVLAYEKRVVTTVDASMRVEAVAREVIRTKVGDVSVSYKVKETGAEFGGEPCGCMIFPELQFAADGPMAAAKAVELAASGELERRLERIPSYPMRRLKVRCEEAEKGRVVEKVRKEAEKLGAELCLEDGVRLSFEDGWLLIRPSGTEPCIRITVEAKTKRRLEELVKLGKQLVRC